jgi:hypothetical protein
MTDEDQMLKYHRCGHPLEWRGCYGSETKYRKYIHPDSMRHPAKMALPLCDRIFQHLEQLGYLKPGVTVVDPMAGTGRTALVASLRGYKTISIELEDKFVKMQEQNRELLKADGWSIVKGDARKLSELLAEKGCAGVVSPPYGDLPVVNYDAPKWTKYFQDMLDEKGYIEWRGKKYTEQEWRSLNHGRIDGRTMTGVPKGDTGYAAVVSPPYGSSEITTQGSFKSRFNDSPPARDVHRSGKGYSPGNPDNIGNLPDRPLAAVFSPPHADTLKGGGGPNYYEFLQQAKGLPPEEWKKAEREWQRNRAENMARYSQNGQNIGNLKDAPLAGITSPPYADCLNEKKNTTSNLSREERLRTAGHDPKEFMGGTARNRQLEDGMRYSSDPSNVGNLKDAPLVGITSPPFFEAQTGGGIAKNEYRGKNMRGQGRNQPDKMGERCGYSKEFHGSAEGQIGNLKDSALVGVTSPPYERGVAFHDKEFMVKSAEARSNNYKTGTSKGHYASPEAIRRYAEGILPEYSQSEENIGNATPATYQSAMLEVYRESFKAGISPLVVVVKNPTKGGKLRRLDLDTVALLEAAGYRTADYHQAILFEVVEQQNLDGTVTKTPKGRLSFFKRLSFAKGSPVAQWEDVIVAVIKR